MAVSSALVVLFLWIVLFTQAQEQRSPHGRRSKRDLQNVKDVTQRLESIVLEVLSTRLESMVTEILASKMKGSEEKMAELVEAKTNATEERLASLEASNTETQDSPAACKYQYLYQYEKEAPHSSADLQWVAKLEAELTRLQEKMSALDKDLQDNNLSVDSLHNASVLALEGVSEMVATSEQNLQSVMQNATGILAFLISSSEAHVLATTDNNTAALTKVTLALEGVVQSVSEMVATSEQNLQSVMQNATGILASLISSSEAHMLATTDNNSAALTKVKQTITELAIRVSAVEDEMRSVTERMTASEHVMSTMQNATENLASMMNISKTLLLTKAENNAAVFNSSVARMEQTTRELETHISAVGQKLNNAALILAEMKNTTAMLEDIKKATQELSYRRTCQAYYDDGQKTSGVYKLQLHYGESLMEVYCEMDNGAGWVVLQRRQDGSVDFYRNWTSYENGFGDLNGEFWLGNRNIHRLTSAGLTQLEVILQSWSNDLVFASYSHFSVGDASSSYTLSVSGYSGTAGDSLTYHNNQKFSTLDQDNDGAAHTHCARDYNKGGWWYYSCDYSNLNGRYGKRASSGHQFINWYHWLGEQSLCYSRLKLK